MLELTLKIDETVENQYDDVIWDMKTEDEKLQLFKAFLKDKTCNKPVKQKAKLTHSSDSSRLMKGGNGAKKPGQIHRKRTERTRTPANPKSQSYEL